MKYREIRPADIPAIFEVRTSTRENRLTMEELADRQITPESVSRALKQHAKGWLCQDGDKVVGFTMGNGESGEVLVLAMLPEAEGQGIGRHLLKLVQDWLFSMGHQELWLLGTPTPRFELTVSIANLAGFPPTNSGMASRR